MLSALEREIIEKFKRLDRDAQKRVQTLIEQSTTSTFDYDTWIRDVEAIRLDIKAQHEGVFPKIDVVDILRDIRDGEDE